MVRPLKMTWSNLVCEKPRSQDTHSPFFTVAETKQGINQFYITLSSTSLTFSAVVCVSALQLRSLFTECLFSGGKKSPPKI